MLYSQDISQLPTGIKTKKYNYYKVIVLCNRICKLPAGNVASTCAIFPGDVLIQSDGGLLDMPVMYLISRGTNLSLCVSPIPFTMEAQHN